MRACWKSAQTPTIWREAPQIVTLRSSALSPGKCSRAKLSLTTITGAPSARSDACNARPATIGTPRVVKYSGVVDCQPVHGASAADGDGAAVDGELGSRVAVAARELIERGRRFDSGQLVQASQHLAIEGRHFGVGRGSGSRRR